MIICRSIIIFVVLLIVLRLMGKRQIGEMQPYELAITLIIADMACIPMTEISIPLAYGLVGILAIFLIHQILTLLSEKSDKWDALISGSPCLIVDKQGIRYKDIKKLNVSVSDLLEDIRTAGYCGFEEVEFAIMETSGNISVISNEHEKPNRSFSELVIANGKWNEQHLERFGIEKSAIEKQIKQYGLKSYKDILACTVNLDGDVFIQGKNKPKAIQKVKL